MADRTEPNIDSSPPASANPFQLTIRVGYYETDGQRRVHHANYLNYFERSRVEMLRAAGFDYRRFEDQGFLLVVTEMNVRYRGAAQFDDLLRVTTTVTEVRPVRIRHHYQIDRDGEVLVDADSTIACIDRTGRICRLPRDWAPRWASSATSRSAD